ncbi:T9SS type A sorting domain-containing protein [Hymenobacter sp. 15J16-1T3B]|uniref:T9SS type A sorting domain-containing protein n=1 Tax=Hymenobacter sp. 15J16-1T3B TaxID=2886941 RepID=UPI001D12F905|nr:T9SS type A sorting domain-containing protein [Hymenobacter sp. 15J16-1T3B]MCC3156981.1 T9SS type A sorting domain-containing protein [Hymenobacter sp. 15J16-1T3B]
MRNTFTLAAALCASVLLHPGADLRAQSLDPTFLPSVLKTLPTSSLQMGVSTLAVQADGKVLAAGGFDFVNGTLTGKLQRFNADGTVDTGFNAGTGANGFVAAALLQPDGKILLTGGFTTFNGTATTNLVRLNANGSLDATFSSSSADVPRQPMSLALQADGKILVSGTSISLIGQNAPGLVRLNADGTRDPSFNPGTGSDGSFVYAAVLQPDGKILAGGTFSSFNGQPSGNVVRLNADGSLDTSFSTVGVLVSGTARVLLRQPNGNILVGGSFFAGSSGTISYLARLLPSGAFDNSFTPGTGPNGSVTSMVAQSSGSVLLGGSFTQYNGVVRGRVARISADGVLDAAFAPGTGANAGVQTLAETSTGQVLIGGSFNQYNATGQQALARLSSSGSLDLGFAPLVEARGTVQLAVPLSTGQLLVQGNIGTFNGTALTGATTLPRRVNADGSLDATYAAAVGGSVLAVPPTSAQYAGRAYVLDNTPSATVRRLLPSGALDNSFTMRTLASRFGTASSGPVLLTGTTAQADGKLLVYGVFSSYDGVTRNGLVRLNGDGTLDTSFNPPASTALPATLGDLRRVTAVFVLPSGKVLYQWGAYSGSSQLFLTQLNADGSVDNAFSIGTGPGNAAGPYPFFSLLPQPDGKLLVWNSSFTSFNGQYTPYGVTRLTPTGAVDATFSGLTEYYTPRCVQADGKILASTGNNILANASSQLVRLNADGSLDTSFTPVAVPGSIFTGDDVLTGVALQADGKPVLYGSFRYVAGQTRIGLARLTATTTATKTSTALLPLTLYPNPARQAARVQLPAGAQQLRLLDLQGRTLQQRHLAARQVEGTLELSTVPAGLYLVQVVGAAGLYQQRLVVTH